MILWIAIALALLILVITVILFSSIHFHVRVFRRGKDDRVEFDVTALFGLVKVHYELPKLKYEGIARGVRLKLEESGLMPVRSDTDTHTRINKEKVEQWLDTIKKGLKATRGFNVWFKETAAHIRITKLDWSTDFSLSDAALTGTATGLLWGFKWCAAGWISQRMRMQAPPRLFVKPIFEDRFCFTTELVCTGSVSTGFVLFAGVRLLRRISQETGGLRQWKKLLSRSRHSDDFPSS